MAGPQIPDDVVKLADAANPVQAHIWQQALEAEGIKSHVVGEFLDAGIGDVPGMSPEVWVHRDDLARAEEILRQGEHAGDETDVDDEEEADE
jgi:hypothetical protein